MRMLHEEAPDEAVPIADPVGRHIVRKEQEARILEPARGQHEQPRRELEPRSREAPRPDAQHGAGVVARLEPERIGVEIAADGAGLAQLFPIDLAEAGRRAEAVDRRFELLRVERQEARAAMADLARSRFRVVAVAGDLAQPMRTAVIRPQHRSRKRPAAIFHPRPLCEIDRVERAAPSAPRVGIASEIADLTDVQIEIG